MRTINLKFNDSNSFKYSIILSLYYDDMIPHPEIHNKVEKFINNYELGDTMNLDNFKKCNYNIIAIVYGLTGKVIDAPSNLIHNEIEENIIARTVKVNEHRYNALKPYAPLIVKLLNLIRKCNRNEVLEAINKVTYDDPNEIKNYEN